MKGFLGKQDHTAKTAKNQEAVLFFRKLYLGFKSMLTELKNFKRKQSFQNF